MGPNKALEYAKDLRTDLKYSLENNEEPTIEEKDIKTIEWLIEQAQRAEMYKSALERISSRKQYPSDFYAESALFEADQRFEFIKSKRNEE